MKKFILPLSALLLLSLIWFGFDNGSKKKVKSKTDYSWLREGDVLFQDMDGEFGEAIKLATRSKFSHCGMVLKQYGEIMVYEAVGPVKYTPIKEWVKHGNNKEFTAKRLIKSNLITSETIAKWTKASAKYNGKGYDHIFEWTNDKLYCSELVWKMYKDGLNLELSTPKKLKDFDLSHPLVKKQLAMRYGSDIPYDETVVSPQDLFDSPLLQEVKP